jgi:hypothetical protein
MPAACDSTLQLSISAETKPFYASIRVQNINSRHSPSPEHGKLPIRVAALAFDFCALYYRSRGTR